MKSCAAKIAAGWLVLAALLFYARPASAWLLFEHDRIGGEGFRRITEADRATLQAAWQSAISSRANNKQTSRYCSRIDQMMSSESVRDESHWCVGFATLASLAGDHACVPDEVTSAIEDNNGWMGALLVESWAREREVAPLKVTDVAKRTISWREHNMAVQGIDPGLVPRAQNNRSHFPAPLDVSDASPSHIGSSSHISSSPTIATDLPDYLRRALAPNAPVSSVTMYLHYHRLALRDAMAVARQCKALAVETCAQQSGPLLWRALNAEAFAIHFLEDSFSAGHIVGSWGDLGQRLGSHDYYSSHGLDVRTWSGVLYTAHGDAYLAPEDERVSGQAVATSLTQLARALRADDGDLVSTSNNASVSDSDNSYTGCDRSLTTPPGLDAIARERFAIDVLEQLPIPTSRTHGMPRFRAEVGGFLGFMLEGNGYAVAGATDQLPSSDARLRLGVGAGFALEGAFTRFMDGRFLLDALLAVSLHEYVVGRRAIGFGGRLRMPFVAVPGDALFLVAPAAIINPRWGYELGRTAAAGGVGGFERQVILRENVSFQFMLGREAIAVWFPDVGWQIDIPTIELRGDRLFTGAFATESILQFGPTLSLFHGETAIGVFVSFAERIRRYMPQSCEEGCER